MPHRLKFISVVLLGILTVTSSAQGAGGDIEVSIDECTPLPPAAYAVILATPGNPLICPPPPATPKVTIYASGNGNARVEWAGDDSNSDILYLKDAKIQANQQISGFNFVFKRVFDPGPADHWYNTHLYALISGQAGNKVTVTTKVEHPVGTEINDLKKTITHTFPPLLIDKYVTPRPKASGLTGQRRLHVAMVLDLKANATLDFGNKWLMFNSQPYPDDPPHPQATTGNSLDSILHGFKDLLGSDGCLGIHVENTGCVGVHVK